MSWCQTKNDPENTNSISYLKIWVPPRKMLGRSKQSER